MEFCIKTRLILHVQCSWQAQWTLCTWVIKQYAFAPHQQVFLLSHQPQRQFTAGAKCSLMTGNTLRHKAWDHITPQCFGTVERATPSEQFRACSYHGMDHVVGKAEWNNFWDIKMLTLMWRERKVDMVQAERRMCTTPCWKGHWSQHVHSLHLSSQTGYSLRDGHQDRQRSPPLTSLLQCEHSSAC